MLLQNLLLFIVLKQQALKQVYKPTKSCETWMVLSLLLPLYIKFRCNVLYHTFVSCKLINIVKVNI